MGRHERPPLRDGTRLRRRIRRAWQRQRRHAALQREARAESHARGVREAPGGREAQLLLEGRQRGGLQNPLPRRPRGLLSGEARRHARRWRLIRREGRPGLLLDVGRARQTGEARGPDREQMIVVPAQAGPHRPERGVAMEIDTTLVRKLLRDQFPRWADLDVRPIEPGGWDNRSFRLGDELVARFPSDEAYASQVEKEYRWLPRLAPHLPAAIPTPIAMGAPGPGYPWCWSIDDWIDGDAASSTSRVNPLLVATDLARFLGALQCIDPQGGPSPGTHNFHRGGDLRVYDDEVDRALAVLDGAIDRRP